jgi:hypothetical protein
MIYTDVICDYFKNQPARMTWSGGCLLRTEKQIIMTNPLLIQILSNSSYLNKFSNGITAVFLMAGIKT